MRRGTRTTIRSLATLLREDTRTANTKGSPKDSNKTAQHMQKASSIQQAATRVTRSLARCPQNRSRSITFAHWRECCEKLWRGSRQEQLRDRSLVGERRGAPFVRLRETWQLVRSLARGVLQASWLSGSVVRAATDKRACNQNCNQQFNHSCNRHHDRNCKDNCDQQLQPQLQAHPQAAITTRTTTATVETTTATRNRHHRNCNDSRKQQPHPEQLQRQLQPATAILFFAGRPAASLIGETSVPRCSAPGQTGRALISCQQERLGAALLATASSEATWSTDRRGAGCAGANALSAFRTPWPTSWWTPEGALVACSLVAGYGNFRWTWAPRRRSRTSPRKHLTGFSCLHAANAASVHVRSPAAAAGALLVSEPYALPARGPSRFLVRC